MFLVNYVLQNFKKENTSTFYIADWSRSEKKKVHVNVGWEPRLYVTTFDVVCRREMKFG